MASRTRLNLRVPAAVGAERAAFGTLASNLCRASNSSMTRAPLRDRLRSARALRASQAQARGENLQQRHHAQADDGHRDQDFEQSKSAARL